MAQEFTRNRITLNASSGSELVIGSADSNVLKTVHTVPASAQDNVILEIVTGTSVTESIEVSIYKNTDLVKTLVVVGGKKSTVEINNLQAGDLIKIKHPLTLSVNTTVLPDTPTITDGYKWYSYNTSAKAGDQGLGNQITLTTTGSSATNVRQYHYYPSAGIAVWLDSSSNTWYMRDELTSTTLATIQDSTYYSNTLLASFSDNWIFGSGSTYQYSIKVDLDAKTLTAGYESYGGNDVYFSAPTNDPDVFIVQYDRYLYARKFSGASAFTVDEINWGSDFTQGDIETFPNGNTYFVGGYQYANSYSVYAAKWDGSSFTTYAQSAAVNTTRVSIAIPSRNELWSIGYDGRDGATAGYSNAYKFDINTETWTKYTDAVAGMTTTRRCFYSATDDIIWFSADQHTTDSTEFYGFDPDTQTVTRTADFHSGPLVNPSLDYVQGYGAVLGSGSNEYYTLNYESHGPYILRASDNTLYFDASRSDRASYDNCYGPLSLHVASSTMYRFENNRNVYLYDVGSSTMSWRSTDTTTFSAYSTSSTYARVRFNWVDEANNKLYYTDYFGALYSFDIDSSTGALSNNTLISAGSTTASIALPTVSDSTKFRPAYLPSSGYFFSIDEANDYFHVGDVATNSQIDTFSFSSSYLWDKTDQANKIAVYTTGGNDYVVCQFNLSGTYYNWFLRVDSSGTIANLGQSNANRWAYFTEPFVVPWYDTGTSYPQRLFYLNNSTSNYESVNVSMTAGAIDNTVQDSYSRDDFLLDDYNWHGFVLPSKYAIGAATRYTRTTQDQLVGARYYNAPSAAGVGSFSISPAIVYNRLTNNPYTVDTFAQSTVDEKSALVATYSTKTDGYVNRVTTTA